MQVKIFLLSILATILAVGVIATPVDVIPTIVGGERTSPTAVNTLLDGNEREAFFVGAPAPRPTGPIITPKEGDVPTPSRSVVARDLVSREPCSINWARGAVTNFHNSRAWKREHLGVFLRLLTRKRCLTLDSVSSLNLINLL